MQLGVILLPPDEECPQEGSSAAARKEKKVLKADIVPADQLDFMHRMSMPAEPIDSKPRTNDNAALLKNPSIFYKTHVHLYKMALKPFVVENLRKGGMNTVLAEQQYDTMSLQEGQIFAYLKDMDISLPACWGSCPYMVKAMANPIDISSFYLPRPADVKVAAMVHALERLLERQLTYLAMGYPTDFDGESLFRKSWSIVALCLEPATVIDLNTDPTLWLVGEPALARFLLAAVKADYVNSVKRTYTIIVSMIANSLGLDASGVYHTHPFLRDDEGNDA